MNHKTTPRISVASFLILLSLVGSTIHAEELTPPVPVPRVDLKLYVGRWYEIARIPNKYQQQCARDVTAEYEMAEDGRIRVVNACIGEDGEMSRARGIAKVVDAETNARLKVSFVSFLGVRPFWGDYWILGLGEHYEYAVVGTPDRKFGWILARRPDPDPGTLERAWRVVEDQGYDITRFRRSSP